MKLHKKLKFWFLASFFPTIALFLFMGLSFASFFFMISSFLVKEFYLPKKPLRIHESGYLGERNCLRLLKKLPREFVIFNQIEIPSQDSPFNEFETDFIVVGLYNIFIVECKRYHGTISCEVKNNDWLKTELYKGKPFTSVVKSPVKQLIRQKKYLSLFLEKFGLQIDIHTLLFVNVEEKNLSLPKDTGIPVFTNKNLAKYIEKVDEQKKSFHGDQERDKLIQILISINNESNLSRNDRLNNKYHFRSYFYKQVQNTSKFNSLEVNGKSY